MEDEKQTVAVALNSVAVVIENPEPEEAIEIDEDE